VKRAGATPADASIGRTAQALALLFVFLQWLTMSNQTEPVANIAVSRTRGSERRGDDVEVT
jgi:hypothetical protein